MTQKIVHRTIMFFKRAGKLMSAVLSCDEIEIRSNSRLPCGFDCIYARVSNRAGRESLYEIGVIG